MTTNSTYPVVLIPDLIVQLAAELPPIAPQPQLPAEPVSQLGPKPIEPAAITIPLPTGQFSKKSPEKIAKVPLFLGGLSIIAAPAIAAAFTRNNLIPLVVFVLAVFLVGLYCYQSHKSFRKRHDDYVREQKAHQQQQNHLYLQQVDAVNRQNQERQQSYKREMEQWTQDALQEKRRYRQWKHEVETNKDAHQVQIRKSHSSKKVIAHRRDLCQQILSKCVIPHDGNKSKATRGRSEQGFERHLKRHFGNKIFTKLEVQNPIYSDGFHYTPDFAYIDITYHLYIDIEIDEPYDLDSRQPKHFLGLETEQVRDKHFVVDRRWVVIRFSEEQVECWPESCCKTIAALLAEITADKSCLYPFANIPKLERMQRWTEHEARRKAESDYRNTYRKQLPRRRSQQ
jgi:hypothetical protein